MKSKMTIIIYKLLNLIKIIFFLILISSINQLEAKVDYFIKTKDGQKVKLKLAITTKEQSAGLSGIPSEEFKNTDGMLFINKKESIKQFWMPNTYFNLDIIFLNKNLKIIAIERNVPHHIGYKTPPKIYITKPYLAQYILEIKPNTIFAKKLQINDYLFFTGPTTLLEILSNIHL